MPSEEQIQIDIKAQLIKTNEAFRQFVESCRNAQSIVVETEDGIQQELQQIEDGMIKDIDDNYESIQNKFLQNVIKIEEDDVDIFADESVVMSDD